jgi:tRNA A-37 threonylcarbamoyl transferase component Bud32
MSASDEGARDSLAGSRTVGRYVIYGEIAQGGMATVHLGRLRGAAGFTRIVAIKKLHAQFAKDPEFVRMFTDEARLAARVRHPNVVPTLDVVSQDGELFLVMEYVHGETLARLIVHSRRAGSRVPPAVACSILCGALHGLHAAHEAVSAQGEPLSIVHRDVSPQNILVGTDGIARVLDFGIAKAAGRMHQTEAGVVKGKMGYMSPEQLYGERLDRRTDTYAAGVVLWESLVCDRLFAGHGDEPALAKMLSTEVSPPSRRVPGVSPALDTVVLRAVDRDRGRRFATALEMALALERSTQPATPSEVGAWVLACAGEAIAPRARLIASLEKQAEESEASDPSLSADAIDGPPAYAPKAEAASGYAPAIAEPVTALSPGTLKAAGAGAQAAGVTSLGPRFAGATIPLASPPSAGPLSGMEGPTTSTSAATTVMPREVSAEPAEVRKSRSVVVIAGAVGLAAGLVTAVALLRTGPVFSAAPAGVDPAKEALSAAPMASAPADLSAAPPPSTAAPSAPSAAAAGSPTPTSLQSAAADPTAPPKMRAPTVPTTAKPAAKPPNCDPPYTIEANGHKRYKRECLR